MGYASSPLDNGANLNPAFTNRPTLGQRDRLIEVGNIEDAVAAQRVAPIDKWPVCQMRLVTLNEQSGRAPSRLELVALAELAIGAQPRVPLPALRIRLA